KAPDGLHYLRHMDAPAIRLTASRPPGAVLGRTGTRRVASGATVTDGILERARRGEFDVLSESPLQLTIDGRVYTARADDVDDSRPTPTPRRRRGMRPWTRWALMRSLLLTDRPLKQREAAEGLGGSQQSISSVTRQLRTILNIGASGMEPIDRSCLLECFASEYPGSRGHEFGWYSLEPPVAQTEHAAAVASSYGESPLISGDVAADRLAPWKLPATGRIYLSNPLDLSGDGFTPAPLSEATLTLCVPEDPTLWRVLHNEGRATGASRLVDPVIAYWDLLNDKNVDSTAAARKLAEYIIGGPG